jgi:hypothetical protein|tara:strand:+ start:1726 stop:2343 length:618 start_codon:yes stop_codon:yes gene_type:complete
MRIGLVATSRSGSTLFRSYVCNMLGLMDSGSWLKHNSYANIEETEFAKEHHLLKVLPHYISEQPEEVQEVTKNFTSIWLHREDIVAQFLSHVARLRTGVNHIYKIEDRPKIENLSLKASRQEFSLFKKRLDCFWNTYHQYHAGEPLISLEYFLSDPSTNLAKIANFFEIDSNHVVNIPVPVELAINYEHKFKNYNKIVEWFEDYG